MLKKTPADWRPTDVPVLQRLADDHPVVDHLLRYRETEKSCAFDGRRRPPPLSIDADGRIHCVFNQTGASTGRISSEATEHAEHSRAIREEGRTIRRAFVAAQGHLFVVADYSQIELRILAHLCGDVALVEASRVEPMCTRQSALRLGVAVAQSDSRGGGVPR